MPPKRTTVKKRKWPEGTFPKKPKLVKTTKGFEPKVAERTKKK